MVLKTVFRLTKERALKVCRLAEYHAQEDHLSGVDTERTMNWLIDEAYRFMEESKRLKAKQRWGA